MGVDVSSADELAARRALLPGIGAHLESLIADRGRVGPTHRPAVLQLTDWIVANYRPGRPLAVVVVCTGNSRRSVLGAMMGNAAASYVGLPEIRFHSAGTAPSAFNPRTAAALRAVGFAVEPTGEEAPRGAPELPNPVYRVAWGTADHQAMNEFSKALGDASLPASGFAVATVCDEANAGCPVVPGAAARIPMPFADPKAADDTPEKPARYAEARDALGRLMVAALVDALHRLEAR